MKFQFLMHPSYPLFIFFNTEIIVLFFNRIKIVIYIPTDDITEKVVLKVNDLKNDFTKIQANTMQIHPSIESKMFFKLLFLKIIEL